eukprot:scaffold72557_cov70-Phaeocystis_antarctica.AAC.6
MPYVPRTVCCTTGCTSLAPQAEPAPARTAGRLAAAYAFRRGGRRRGAGVAAAPALPWLGLGLGF